LPKSGRDVFSAMYVVDASGLTKSCLFSSPAETSPEISAGGGPATSSSTWPDLTCRNACAWSVPIVMSKRLTLRGRLPL
jgi:hypothetical protein